MAGSPGRSAGPPVLGVRPLSASIPRLVLVLTATWTLGPRALLWADGRMVPEECEAQSKRVISPSSPLGGVNVTWPQSVIIKAEWDLREEGLEPMA